MLVIPSCFLDTVSRTTGGNVETTVIDNPNSSTFLTGSSISCTLCSALTPHNVNHIDTLLAIFYMPIIDYRLSFIYQLSGDDERLEIVKSLKSLRRGIRIGVHVPRFSARFVYLVIWMNMSTEYGTGHQTGIEFVLTQLGQSRYNIKFHPPMVPANVLLCSL